MTHKPLRIVPDVPRVLAAASGYQRVASAADHLAVLDLPGRTTTARACAVGHQLVVPRLPLAPAATTRSTGRQAGLPMQSWHRAPPAFKGNQVMSRATPMPCWLTRSERTRTTVATSDSECTNTRDSGAAAVDSPWCWPRLTGDARSWAATLHMSSIWRFISALNAASRSGLHAGADRAPMSSSFRMRDAFSGLEMISGQVPAP